MTISSTALTKSITAVRGSRRCGERVKGKRLRKGGRGRRASDACIIKSVASGGREEKEGILQTGVKCASFFIGQ